MNHFLGNDVAPLILHVTWFVINYNIKFSVVRRCKKVQVTHSLFLSLFLPVSLSLLTHTPIRSLTFVDLSSKYNFILVVNIIIHSEQVRDLHDVIESEQTMQLVYFFC